jgi:isopropylmalate/homocitrate/citramalate synthase
MSSSGCSSGDDLVFYEEIFPFEGPPRIASGNRDIMITDTTLRDGQQGWREFTVEEGLRIYRVLAELGSAIESTELFLYTPKDRKLVSAIKSLELSNPRPIGWIRASLSDLKLLQEAGLKETIILASISDYHIHFKFGLSREQAFEKYLSVVEEALKLGISVRCSLEDFTRASPSRNIFPFVSKLMKLSERYRSQIRIKLADTLGLGLPFPDIPPPRGIPAVIRLLTDGMGVSGECIEFHGHNDLGLVVANHLVAWIYGARASNCTLMGIGERTGNCPLEVMLIHYVGIRGHDGTANLKAIREAAQLFRSLGLKIPEFQPLVGGNAFRTKAGIHIDGLMKNPKVYLSFDPLSVLEIPYGVAITPHSGRSAIALWVSSHLDGGKIDAKHVLALKEDPRLEALYNELMKLFDEERSLNDDELMRIAVKYFPELNRGNLNERDDDNREDPII